MMTIMMMMELPVSALSVRARGVHPTIPNVCVLSITAAAAAAANFLPLLLADSLSHSSLALAAPAKFPPKPSTHSLPAMHIALPFVLYNRRAGHANRTARPPAAPPSIRQPSPAPLRLQGAAKQNPNRPQSHCAFTRHPTQHADPETLYPGPPLLRLLRVAVPIGCRRGRRALFAGAALALPAVLGEEALDEELEEEVEVGAVDDALHPQHLLQCGGMLQWDESVSIPIGSLPSTKV